MPDFISGKPNQTEYPEYDKHYVELVAGDDIVGVLTANIGRTMAVFAAISDEASLKRPAPGKWSPREVVGHMSDVERIFAYRALCIARGDTTPLASFEQDDYVRTARSQERGWAELREEFELVRRSNLAAFRAFTSEDWRRIGNARGGLLSARASAFILAGHELHHQSRLR
jgi:hypothetical protein